MLITHLNPPASNFLSVTFSFLLPPPVIILILATTSSLPRSTASRWIQPFTPPAPLVHFLPVVTTLLSSFDFYPKRVSQYFTVHTHTQHRLRVVGLYKLAAGGRLILWGEVLHWLLFICSLLSDPVTDRLLSPPPPAPTVTPGSPFEPLNFCDTNTQTHNSHTLLRPLHLTNRWEGTVGLRVYTRAGEQGAFNIHSCDGSSTVLFIEQVVHSVLKKKEDAAFHLCLERRQLQKWSQPKWSLIKLRHLYDYQLSAGDGAASIHFWL